MQTKIESDGKATRVSLDGELVAGVRGALDKVLQSVHTTELVFDCGGISRINSVGAGEWINFVEALERQVSQISFERCSVPFIVYCNAVRAFVGKNGKMRSFHFPVYCRRCDDTTPVLMKTVGLDLDAIECGPCATCGGACEPEADPSLYLEFLR